MTKSKVSGDMLFKVCILDDCKSDTIGPTSETFHPHSLLQPPCLGVVRAVTDEKWLGYGRQMSEWLRNYNDLE